MCTAVSSHITNGVSNSDLSKIGLVDSHAYSLIAALEVDLGLLSKEKLILLRNPWGFREWSGDWSDTSNKWKDYPSVEK